MNISGIYQIQSKIKPERIYIGSAVNIYSRWIRHLKDLEKGIHHSIKLQRHYNKYSKNDLIFSILIGCAKKDLLTTEQFYLDSKKTWFNTCKVAGSNLGVVFSPEARKNMSDGRKKCQSIPWNKGKKNIYSEEVLIKMRTARKGVKDSEKTKKKKSDAMIGNTNGKSLKGMCYSEERKQQCRDVWVKRKLDKIYNN